MACEITAIFCVNLVKRWWLIDRILEIWFNDCLVECFDYSLSGMADKRLRIKPTKSRKPSVVLLPAVSIPLDEGNHVRSIVQRIPKQLFVCLSNYKRYLPITMYVNTRELHPNWNASRYILIHWYCTPDVSCLLEISQLGKCSPSSFQSQLWPY